MHKSHHGTLLLQLLQKFQGQGPARSFVAVRVRPGLAWQAVPIDGGGHKDQIRAQKGLDQRQRDGGRLVNYNKLRLRKGVRDRAQKGG